MKLTFVVLAIMALFAAMAVAGPKAKPGQLIVSDAQWKKSKKYCLKGRKKNGKCITGKLRVRSADSDEFFEVPDVEDVEWGVDGE